MLSPGHFINKLKSAIQIVVIVISLTSIVQAQSYYEPITPIPATENLNQEKVALGRTLFHDKRLSSNNEISCASCHKLDKGGADSGAVSFGVNGAAGSANTPTVYNSDLNFVQFWNGRAVTLDEQANGPVHNPVEMNTDWKTIEGKLKLDATIVDTFNSIYDEGITAANIRDAIVEFERSLRTTDSPFDRWLKGDQSALTEQASNGYQLFKSYGCISCHQGANVGGNMYAYFGALKDIRDYYHQQTREMNQDDLGRFSVTSDPEDRYLFKVPSLRLALLTPPYFHDGSAKTLEEAIQTMSSYQLGREIPEKDIADIKAFLESLIGKHPELRP